VQEQTDPGAEDPGQVRDNMSDEISIMSDEISIEIRRSRQRRHADVCGVAAI
jgi:hypothetical protein